MASLAPLLSFVAIALAEGEPPPSLWVALCAGSLALLLLGGLVTPRGQRLGRALSTVGLGGFVVALAVHLAETPDLALITLVLFVAIVGSIWGFGGLESFRLSRRRARELTESRARLACGFYGVELLLAWLWDAVAPWGTYAAGAGLVVALGYTGAWLVGARRRKDPMWKWAIVAALLAAGGGAIGDRSPLGLVTWGGLVPFFVLTKPRNGGEEKALRLAWWQPVAEHPARLLVVTFVALSSMGTIVLLLPFSATDGESIGLLDAAFTAVSAVCVTGLIVLDTPTDFSAFGEVTLLVLIQLGGLGIMSFSSVTLSLLGLRPSLRHEAAVAGLVGAENRGALRFALGRVVAFTVVAEAVGALLLTAAFLREGEAIPSAIWRGVFTAVSAFCNAGFALQSDSLIGYQESAWVLHVVGALIVVGGLSPATVAALGSRARRGRVAIEHKIALAATGVLLAGGAVVILALEWHHTLGDLSAWDRVTNAWFQSLTTRTAGFNSVDIALVRPATLTVLMMLMFVGGSPGGTAGGVKTTTVVVLLLAVVSAIRGRWYVAAFRRRVPHVTVYKAAAIVTLGVLSLLLADLALQMTQSIGAREVLFEAVSALGTVGLSVGATPLLDEVGKIVVMGCMFAGRVGPLSLFLFLQGQRTVSSWTLIEEEVAVG